MKILVTGANGFVGRHLCRVLDAEGLDVVRAVRNPMQGAMAVGNMDGRTDWSEALRGVDVVVHLAARVHQIQEKEEDPLAAFRAVNAEGTANLAQQAGAARVKRFIFISSIKADDPDPDDFYGISKAEAECGLKEICDDSGMELVIIRPPLVYGPGVGANFLRLMKLAASGMPLPLGAVKNRRSLVYVGNLCDLIRICLEHPAAAGQTFLVSDDQDVSTPELLRLLAKAQHKKAWLFPVPEKILRAVGRLSGRSAEVERLCGSLAVDIEHTKNVLDWARPVRLQEGIQKTVAWFREENM